MYEAGLRNGDKILTVNGDSILYQNKLNAELLLAKNVQVERNGKKIDIVLPADLIDKLVVKGKRSSLVDVRVPSFVGAFNEKDTSYAKKAGLKEFDKVINVNGYPVTYVDQIRLGIYKAPRKDSAALTILRNNKDTIKLMVKLNKDWRMGLPTLNYEQLDSLKYVEVINTNYNFLSSFPAGVRKTGEQLNFYVRQFKKILDPETGAYKGLGGFRNMGRLFGGDWDWQYFWTITGFLSIILAFMNLLPIPGLDGGHVMFTLWEMITKRKPSDKFLERAQIFGMVILLGLMVFANGNDWFGWGKNRPDPKPEEQLCHTLYN
jgi:regulator of sigma E protease